LTAQLLVLTGLFFSSRWRIKLSGHTYKAGRQTLAVLLFWFSLVGLLGGFIMIFAVGSRTAGNVGFDLVMIAIWSFVPYLCRKWLKRLRVAEAETFRPANLDLGLTEAGKPSAAICRSCNRENDETSKYCGYCGKVLFTEASASEHKQLSVKSRFALNTHAISLICFGSIGVIILYIIISDRPFSFFFPERIIEQNVITSSVVNVLCQVYGDENSISGGSGTFISTNGMIITASHIILRRFRE
jgi:hypothetical protein